MNSSSKAEPAEETEPLKHGIAFTKQKEPARGVMKDEDYSALQEEFSVTGSGIEIEKPQQKPEAPDVVTENKKSEEDAIQKASQDKVVILPESPDVSDSPEEEDLFAGLKKRKQ